MKFSENRARLWENVENYGTARQAVEKKNIYKTAHALCMLYT